MYRNAPFYLAILFVLTVAAFWPVYFAKLSDVNVYIHVHTIMGILWLGLMINQTWLARQGNFLRHIIIGKLSYMVVPLLVFSNLIIFQTFLDLDTPFEQAFGLQIGFYDLTGMALYASCYLLAITKFKHSIHLHARLMIATLSMLIFPVISRLFLFYESFGMGPMGILSTGIYATELLFVALIIHDWRTGKVYPIYPLVLVYVLLQHIGFLYANQWPWWQEFAKFYSGTQ